MATTWKAPTWRMPNEKNQSKFENYGLTFDGSEFVNCGANANLDLNNAFSISAWVKYTSTSSMVVLSKRETTKISLLIELGSGKPFTAIRDASSNIAITNTYSGTYNDGNWHHIVATFDRTVNELKLYVDNELKETASTSSVGDIAPTTSDLIIGRRSDTSSSFFNGSISEANIFDYALSSTQISSLYNSGSPINPMTLKPAPIAYYPLGGNASTGGDASNTLSVPNVAVPDASVFDFDGISQYIDCGDNDAFSFGNGTTDSPFSISAWFNADVLSSANRFVISKFTTSTQREYLLELLSGSVSMALCDTSNSSNRITVNHTTGVTFETGRWYHIAFTYDGSGTTEGADIYVDGIVASTATKTKSVGYVAMGNKSAPLKIGERAGKEFDGQISNVQIWNTALSASEVSTLYNSGVPLTGTQPQASNLKAWYKLDQSANWEADSSGAWQIPDAVSAYPQSFDFGDANAGGQYIDAPTDIGGFTKCSTSVWLNPSSVSAKSTIFATNTANNFNAYFWTGNIIYVTVDGAYGYLSAVNSYIDANKWNHLSIVYDGTFTDSDAATQNAGRLKMYVNGSYISFQGFGGTIPSSIPVSGSDYIKIGTTSPTTYEFGGELSNFTIYDTNLSSSQVLQLYNNGTPLTTAIATDNLKAWYKLDDNEKFDGTNWSVENQKYPAGFDSALSFPASDDYISIGNTTLGINTAIAISAWVKTSVNTGYGAIIGEDNAGPKRNWNLLRKNDDIFFTIYHDATGTNKTNITTSTVNISDDKWHHIVGTWDGTTNADSMKVYFDGVEVGQATPSSTGINTEAAEPWIGNSTDNPSGYNNWTGELSNIAIYNTNLDSSAVTALYNNGTPETSISSSPVSWWKLDNTTTGIQDSVGSNDGTNNGATKVNTFVSTEAATSSGMTEQNLVFNNVSSLNGESSGMDTSNLVTSTLTRQVPYNSYSLNFDYSSSDAITLGNTIGNGFTQITCSIWVKLSTTELANNSRYRNFLVKFNGANLGPFELRGNHSRGDSYDNKLFFRVGTDTGSYGFTDAGFALSEANRWYHIVGTYDGSNVKTFVDGIEITSISANGTLISNSDNATIGFDYQTGGFDGQMSNASIFNVALTSTEVMKLYNSGVPGDLSNFNPSPTAWWSLGSDSYFNGSNWICPDLISTNNGTSANMDDDALIGNAPNSTANGTSTNMAIDANLTGNAPNSSNNSFSVNMSYDDRETSVPS